MNKQNKILAVALISLVAVLISGLFYNQHIEIQKLKKEISHLNSTSSEYEISSLRSEIYSLKRDISFDKDYIYSNKADIEALQSEVTDSRQQILLNSLYEY